MSTTDAESRARALVPLGQPPDDRPRAPSRACAACGALLDPLRAPVVLAFEDGYRFLCSAACLDEHRRGARHRQAPTARPDPITRGSGALPTPLETPRARWPVAEVVESPVRERGLWVGSGLVALALVLGIFATASSAALASAIASGLAALAALHASWPAARDVGFLAWALGPIGVVLAAAASYAAVVGGYGSWLGVEGAALAAAAVVARASFDAEARAPVARAVARLTDGLPSLVRVPVQDASDPLAMSVGKGPASALRTGDEVIVSSGETVPVDGVVRAGEARVLAFPGARTPIARAAGDSVLAGAQVARGVLRILATRVGDERALVRVARFGSGAGRDAAPIARLSDVVARWGALATLGLALGVLAVAEGAGSSAPLSAASAVLLAAPLLAVRRAAASPLLAAAASAGARGIVFRDPAALDSAGHVSIVALSARGMLTEGRPEVVEVHAIGDSDPDALVALAAGAEQAAGAHPIARALAAYAERRRLAPAEVRRTTVLPGRGVTASTADGRALVVGSRRLLLDEGISVAAADAESTRVEARGRTPVFVALDGRVRAVVSLEDVLRVGARAAVQRLFDLGSEVVLLTGDQRGVVERVATALDVTHVKAELLPEERGQEVGRLRDAGGTVAAIGLAGVDDAVLAAAHVGIVLAQAGGPGGERAVALVSDDVRDAAEALWIARAAREQALRATRAAAVAFGVIVAAAATGLVVPGIAAVLAVGVDAYGVRAGARLLRRIALRLPA